MVKRGSIETFLELPRPPQLPLFDLWKELVEVAEYPGVYVILGPGAVGAMERDNPWGRATPVYVGQGKNIRKRLRSTGHPVGRDGCAYLTTKVFNLKERLYLESYLVGLLKPPYNWSNLL